MGVSGRIARYFVSSQMTPLLALVALLMGIFATLVTPREEEPQIDVTMADVFIAFPGASVQDVENLVATPAEQVLSRMSGVEHVYSMSQPGMAVVTVQFEVGVKYNDAVVRLYDSVHSNRDWLSPNLGVLEPVVKPRGIDDVPIVSLTFWTADPARSAFELQQVARAAEVDFKRVKGTRDVSTLGGPDHVLRVSMDSERMNAFAVTAQDIAAALRLGNARQTSGSLVAGNREVLVETGSYLESAADVRQLVVAVRGSAGERKPVFISDVADVEDGPDQPRRYVWFGNRDGEFPAVTVQVSKKPGVNAADVASAVIARAESLKGTLIPAGIEVTTTRNYGQTATDKAQKLIGKLVFATAFVVVLVFFALGRREALIVGVAVSLTLAATLFASWAWGFTLNRVSLFALIFSIGILVDDAIVVVENIHRWQALQPGKPLLDIIPLAVDEVGGPTILATFTVIAALLPMAFVTGLMGPYMSPIPINSSLGMFISLAVAFVVTPWLAARLLAKTAHADADAGDGSHGGTGESRSQGRLDRLFRRLLTPFLDVRKGGAARRWLLLAIVLLIVGSVALAAVQLVVLKMLPFDNKSEFQVVLDMPVGTPLEETARVLHELGAAIGKVPEVSNYQAYAGTASPINFNGLVRQYYLRAAPELGDLQVNLVDHQQRARKSHEIAISVREAIEAIGKRAGGNAKVVEVPPGPPVLSPIVAEVYGPDYRGQRAVAKEVRKVLEATPDLVAIDDSVNAGGQRSVLHVLQNKAALLGVAQSDIVEVTRMAIAGNDVTPVHNTGSKYEIPVRLTLPAEQRSSLDALLKLRVRSRDGQLVPVSELVEVRELGREQAIYHKNLLPVVYVVADMGGKLDSPLYGMFAARSEIVGRALDGVDHAAGTLDEWFITQPTAPDASYSIKWDGEWQVTYETFRDMGIAYGVGLILIYLLVVAHFKSYLVPLIIMAPIPLTIIGVMPGHALLGSQYTATSMIGMIALAGIIVRNSILLVDFIRQQIGEGMELREAIVQSAAVRAKPIALTGLAAMLGAMFILDDPIFNGLAISLIFGIFVSTLLTLVVIPVLYYAAFRKENQT
ncbi:MAG: efflux RND transporter permease subunit [Candidatus Accumulibacter sp.]|jgi:Cation/multidrug efflux pump|uniref:efflux RND transporter permease subunit n=1 Tax=Accumulibacter sp. TaxID=2053492 RepID=UPI0012C7D185|nr:efflux RND transporter permease subunit [Accumulibacter sp.]MBL8369384.1 efflux RND transporter permease subunit [Accumulibacter sp.]MBN8515162.1 efflux RND transporter permease subunit [Accumulibacter sp.]MQM33208.1 multidrug transporter AcrB [Candidatus Accumulibacter phosphatis]